MLDVHRAVELTTKTLKDLYADRGLEDVMLEEAELSDDCRQWIVTVSFVPKDRYQLLGLPDKTRSYKTITIDAETGDFVSIKIRST